jgi:hypothetical protein
VASIPPLSTGAGPATGQGADAARPARAEAQRAFFQAALNRALAVAPTAAQSHESAQPKRQVPATHDQGQDSPPDRILRPGSLVNIVV